MTNIVTFPALGWTFTVNRVLLHIGSFDLYWYGALIALGMLLALVFAFHYAPDFGIDGDRLVDVVIIGTVMAIVCARAYYVAFAPFEYHSIWEVLDIRNGGIAVYGSIIGAFLFGGLAARWRKIPLLPLFDLVGMGFLIGQAVGRWGNFVNQEAFGTNTTLPWGMYSAATQSYLTSVQAALAAEGVTVDPALPVHPTFLYESLWCALGFVLIFLRMKKRRFDGELFLDYIIWYSIGRFFIEGVRTDALMLTATLRVSQVVAVAAIAVSLILWAVGRRRQGTEPLKVPLAVADIKKRKDGPLAVIPERLPASAPHKEFAAATRAMNARLAAPQEDAHAEDAPAEDMPAEQGAPTPPQDDAPAAPVGGGVPDAPQKEE